MASSHSQDSGAQNQSQKRLVARDGTSISANDQEADAPVVAERVVREKQLNSDKSDIGSAGDVLPFIAIGRPVRQRCTDRAFGCGTTAVRAQRRRLGDGAA